MVLTFTNWLRSSLFFCVLSCGQIPAAEEPDRFIEIRSMTTVLIRHAEISPREAGVIESIDVVPNALVRQGDVLIRLDSERQQIAVKAAELNLAIAELNSQDELILDSAQASIREAEQRKVMLDVAARISTRMAESDIAVRLSEKNRESAQYELDRAMKSRESFSGSVSAAELNRLKVLYDQRTLEIEKAQEDRAISQLRPRADAAAVEEQAEILARSRIRLAQEQRQLQIAQAERDVSQNDLDLARLLLDRRRLRAPFDGTVVEIRKQTGEWVEPGSPVLRLINLDRLRVEGFLEANVGRPDLVNSTALLTFPARPELGIVKAVVTYVSAEIDPLNQQMRLWAEFDNSDLHIQPGLLADMKIIIPSATVRGRH